MATDPSHIANLLLRLHRDQLSDTDRRELDAWIAESAENAELYRELTEEDAIQAGLRELERFEVEGVRSRILARMPEAFGPEREAHVVRMRVRRVAWRWVAAVLIGLLGMGVWVLVGPGSDSKRTLPSVAARDVAAPARSRATLTLADGRQVAIDSAATGALATQGGVQVVKASGGLTYQANITRPGSVLYNTLSNPRGSRIVDVTLSDGTRVWLNAESSLRYPVFFTGKEREVEITGEGYFEVAKKVGQPFMVDIKDGAKVEVLGTAFNVNAYPDERRIAATLLQGSVRVGVGDQPGVVLKPGQQAVVAVAVDGGGAKGIRVNRETDLDQVMAWKNGLFSFAGADLPTVMRQLSRWYDIDVTYEGKMPARSFNGEIGKTLSLDQLLKLLTTTTRLHYTIEGKKLIIQP
jgi:transmembrane sensor